MATTATDKTTLTYKYPEWANETLTWDLLSSIAINSAGEVILKKSYDVVLDANGEATDDLPTPDSTGDAAWLWQLNHPDGTEPNVTFAYNALSQSVAVILAASVSTSTPSDIVPLLTAKVDRVGDTMTGDLTMIDASLVNPDTVDFATDYAPTELEPVGSMFWDSVLLEMRFRVDQYGYITIGTELWKRMTNLSGAQVVNGDVVSGVGATGNRQAFVLTDATDKAKTRACIGLVTVPTINNNAPGRITKQGEVQGLDTSAFAEGAEVFVDPLNPGKLTDTEPSPGNYIISIGIVLVSHATVGVINVNIRIIQKMAELSDINGTALTTSGQFFVWDQANGYLDATENVNNFNTFYALAGQINIEDEAGADYPTKFTAAITRLQNVTNGEGGSIYFPPGRYDLSAGGLVIPRKTGLKYLVIEAYGAVFYTSSNNITLIKRTYPADTTEAADGMSSERIIIRGAAFIGNSGTGQVGIDVAVSNRATYQDCEFSALTTAAIQTACVGGLISRCNAGSCNQDGFIQRSGYGEGTPLWTGATTANSAGNFSSMHSCRVYNAAGARSAFRILANNAVVIEQCINEGLDPQYGIYYDNQSHTSGKLFTVSNFHSENVPSAAVIYIDTDGHAIIDRFQQRKSGAVVLVDASNSNGTSGLIEITNYTDIAASQTFTAGGRVWWFDYFSSAGAGDPSNTSYWTGGTLPAFLNWRGSTSSGIHGQSGQLLLGSKTGVIYGDGSFVDGSGNSKLYNGDTTPSVAGFKGLTLTGTSYTVTTFDDGFDTKLITVYKSSDTITVQHNPALIVMIDATDWTTGHPVRQFYYINSRWYQV